MLDSASVPPPGPSPAVRRPDRPLDTDQYVRNNALRHAVDLHSGRRGKADAVAVIATAIMFEFYIKMGA